jgi:tetratricopeptide (TPR) repeat protein
VGFVLLAAVAFVGLSIHLVHRESAERMDDTQTLARLAHMKMEKAKARLVEDPEDMGALKFLIRRSVLDGDMGNAMTLFMRAEALAPEDDDLQVYGSALAILVGMPDRAFARLDAVLEAHPEHVEALWWKGVALASMGRFDTANAALEGAIAHGKGTEEATLAKRLILEIELASNVEIHASGKVEWAEGAVLPEEGVLYVAALRAPVSGGPPLAAARFPRFEFPMAFSLSAANMPMGGEWPEQFWMRVRIDADGDPITHSEADVTTEILGPFEKGAEGLLIRLGD